MAQFLASNDRIVLRACLDDFKRPWVERHLYDRASGDGYYRNAFDLHAVRTRLLEPASDAGTGEISLCSIDPITQIDHSNTRVRMPVGGVLIIDGVFALRPELNDLWDLRIWVDIGPEQSLERGIRRDSGREGAAEAERLHRDRYGVAERIYIVEVDPISCADIVVDNTDFDSPRLVRG